jgi:hypothetical protein
LADEEAAAFHCFGFETQTRLTFNPYSPAHIFCAQQTTKPSLFSTVQRIPETERVTFLPN